MCAKLDTSPTEEELAELDEFLLSDACDEETLTVDEAHGFLTSVVVGPDEVPMEEWLVEVWGEPRFGSEDERQRMTAVLRRLYEDIEDTLRDGERFEPLIIEEEEDGELFESYEGWCYGFMLGIARNSETWESLPQDQQAMLAPMAQLALLANEEAEETMDDEEYLSWVELLPGAVSGIYAFWHR